VNHMFAVLAPLATEVQRENEALHKRLDEFRMDLARTDQPTTEYVSRWIDRIRHGGM